MSRTPTCYGGARVRMLFSLCSVVRKPLAQDVGRGDELLVDVELDPEEGEAPQPQDELGLRDRRAFPGRSLEEGELADGSRPAVEKAVSRRPHQVSLEPLVEVFVSSVVSLGVDGELREAVTGLLQANEPGEWVALEQRAHGHLPPFPRGCGLEIVS
jgi:hypothetical protein